MPFLEGGATNVRGNECECEFGRTVGEDGDAQMGHVPVRAQRGCGEVVERTRRETRPRQQLWARRPAQGEGCEVAVEEG
jgi:hypothetical protein